MSDPTAPNPERTRDTLMMGWTAVTLAGFIGRFPAAHLAGLPLDHYFPDPGQALGLWPMTPLIPLFLATNALAVAFILIGKRGLEHVHTAPDPWTGPTDE